MGTSVVNGVRVMVEEETCVLEGRVDVIALLTIVLESTDEGNEGVRPTEKSTSELCTVLVSSELVDAVLENRIPISELKGEGNGVLAVTALITSLVRLGVVEDMLGV